MLLSISLSGVHKSCADAIDANKAKRYNLRTTRGLEEHHILFGRGRRELSERYGLKVWLCHDHHNEPPLGVHFDPAARRELEQAAQFAFDELHGPGSFAEVFGEEI